MMTMVYILKKGVWEVQYLLGSIFQRTGSSMAPRRRHLDRSGKNRPSNFPTDQSTRVTSDALHVRFAHCPIYRQQKSSLILFCPFQNFSSTDFMLDLREDCDRRRAYLTLHMPYDNSFACSCDICSYSSSNTYAPCIMRLYDQNE